MKRIAAILFPALLCGADPSGFMMWSSQDLKGYDQKLKSKMAEAKQASEQLGKWDNHLAMVAHREADGEAELHKAVADFFVVQSGEATLVVGGQVVDGKTTGPNEVRGPKIEGGMRHKLTPGDIVHIPANTPHQLLIEKGKVFNYFVVKAN